MTIRRWTVFIVVFGLLILDACLSVYLSILSDREVHQLCNITTSDESEPHHRRVIQRLLPILQYNYSFFTTQFDFVVFSALRITVVLAGLAGVMKNPVDGPPRIKTFSQLAVCGFLVSLIFSPLKLLALYEKLTNLTTLKCFWINFANNATFSIVAFVCWRFLLANVRPTAPNGNGSAVGVLENGDVVDHADNRGLLDDAANAENTTTEQASDTEIAARKKTDDKKEEKLSLSASRSIIWRIFKYCFNEWLWYLTGFGFLVFYSAARMFLPYFTGQVVDSVTVGSHERLMKAVLDLAILSVVSAIFSGLRGGCFMVAIGRINIRIRSELFASLVKQEISFFDVTKTGEITSRLTADCQTLSDTFALNLNVFLRNFIMFIGSLIIMFTLSWQLTLSFVMAMPLCWIIVSIFGSIFEKLSKTTQDNLAKANEVADEVLGSMRTVRSFANEKGESLRYDTKLVDVLRVMIKRAFIYIAYNCLSEMSTAFILVVTVWYGGHLVLTARMTPAVLVSFLLYELLLGETIYCMGLVYTGLMEAAGAAKKVFDLIDRQPTIKNDGKLAPTTLEGRIEFKNVSFAYPSRPKMTVLKDVCFWVDPGEIVALVGPSGGGKSSCISLLEHFYEPLSGDILLDGVSVQDFDHSYLHKTVSLVGQEPVLYARSITDNIAYGLEKEEYTFEDVVNCSKLANAHQFVVAQSAGYETDVGEKGAQLSGGQKQRVAIARAIIRKPKILLLDEATSALDAESEHLVQQALYENLAGYSILLIAHRLSTVKKADRIVVINEGCVVEQGKHDDLLQNGGLYRNLVEKQLLGTADPT